MSMDMFWEYWWYHDIALMVMMPWDGLFWYMYIWFDMMIHMVLQWWLSVATRPLWSDLGKGRIVEILWSSDRGCYGWCLARQRGRVYHGVATWLIQSNTSVKQSCIFYFSILILKTYTYYVFKMYMYYERNIGDFQCLPGLVLSEKIFRLAHDF